jgi:hypothetical protein
MGSPDDLLPFNNAYGARGSVVGWGTMLQAGRMRVRLPMTSLDLIQLFQPHYGPRVDSASNRNENQESSWWYGAAGV